LRERALVPCGLLRLPRVPMECQRGRVETERSHRGRTFLRVVAVLAVVAAGYAGLRQLARLRVARKGVAHLEAPAAGADGVSMDRPAVRPAPESVTPDRRQTRPSESAASTFRPPRSQADTRPAAVSEHAVVAHRQQAVIDRVGRDYSGQPFDTVLPALRSAFVADGLTLPTRPWLEAVATDIAAGHRFLVGGVGEERHTGGGEHVVKGEHELWFHPDPKIEHIPPGTRTSFRKDDPRANTPTPPES
jgi:hypothetical protein